VLNKHLILYGTHKTVRQRISYLTALKNLILRDFELLAAMITEEHGKVIAESRAELMKGLETLEYAEAGLVLLAGDYSQG